MIATRSDLLMVGRRTATVELNGMDAPVLLQAPSMAAWLDYQEYLRTLGDASMDNLVRLVSMTVVDGEGKPLLTDEDCRALPHDVMIALARAAADLIKIPEAEPTKGKS
jgi:hypothetical protein